MFNLSIFFIHFLCPFSVHFHWLICMRICVNFHSRFLRFGKEQRTNSVLRTACPFEILPPRNFWYCPFFNFVCKYITMRKVCLEGHYIHTCLKHAINVGYQLSILCRMSSFLLGVWKIITLISAFSLSFFLFQKFVNFWCVFVCTIFDFNMHF